jgi:hypothetical protein
MLYRNATLSETRAAAQDSDRSRGTAEDQNLSAHRHHSDRLACELRRLGDPRAWSPWVGVTF